MTTKALALAATLQLVGSLEVVLGGSDVLRVAAGRRQLGDASGAAWPAS